MVCKDINDSFLVNVLHRLNVLFWCGKDEEFITSKFFGSHNLGFYTLNARMVKAFSVILECIKELNPAKELWKKLPEDIRNVHEATKPSVNVIPAFQHLHNAFVSI